MKKIIVVFIFLFVSTFFIPFFLKKQQNEVFRMHIRANSNSAFDQYVKHYIKDNIAVMLSSVLENIQSYNDAYNFLSSSINVIEDFSNHLLKKHHCNYNASVKIDNIYFEEKYTDKFSMRAGYYDSIVVNLGEAQGNNWWCLVYPSLSFIPINDVVDYENIIYKSKLIELSKKHMGI